MAKKKSEESLFTDEEFSSSLEICLHTAAHNTLETILAALIWNSSGSIKYFLRTKLNIAFKKWKCYSLHKGKVNLAAPFHISILMIDILLTLVLRSTLARYPQETILP